MSSVWHWLGSPALGGLAALAAVVAAVRLKPDTTYETVRLKPDTTYITRMSTRRARGLLVAAALPTAVTLIYEWTTGDTPSNAIRAFAGAPLGAAVAFLVVDVN